MENFQGDVILDELMLFYAPSYHITNDNSDSSTSYYTNNFIEREWS